MSRCFVRLGRNEFLVLLALALSAGLSVVTDPCASSLCLLCFFKVCAAACS